MTEVEGITCTSWARTLVDMAASRMSDRQLERALERTFELRIFDRGAIDGTLERSKGKRGTGRLTRLLTGLSEDDAPTRQELERRFRALVRQAGLPTPVVNAYIGELEVDFHWPAHGLVVETDGRATHGHEIAFHRDRDRDLYLQERGGRVVRLTWRQVTEQPERVAELLSRLLAELGFGSAGLGRGALA